MRTAGCTKQGDEWNGQAKFCGVDYEIWKRSLVEALLIPNLSRDTKVLEIGPGHGRWSEIIAGHCRELILADLSPTCIEYCKQRLAGQDNVHFFITDGKTLPRVADSSVDFFWSFDAFVHMEGKVIDSYLGEIRRVLRPAGKAILHHAGRTHAFLWLGFLKDMGRAGRNLHQLISMRKLGDDDGWRSNVSKELVQGLARKHDLLVESQIRFWGEGKIGVPRFGDYLTTLRRN